MFLDCEAGYEEKLEEVDVVRKYCNETKQPATIENEQEECGVCLEKKKRLT